MKTLRCEKCRRVVAEVRDGKLIKGMITYCPSCKPDDKPPMDVPDFIRDMFK